MRRRRQEWLLESEGHLVAQFWSRGAQGVPAGRRFGEVPGGRGYLGEMILEPFHLVWSLVGKASDVAL